MMLHQPVLANRQTDKHTIVYDLLMPNSLGAFLRIKNAAAHSFKGGERVQFKSLRHAIHDPLLSKEFNEKVMGISVRLLGRE